MSKRFTIGLLVFFAGVGGNLVAGWLQQGKWAIQPTAEQFLGTLAGAGLILFIVALLESERALAWNWRWHRFWYLHELQGHLRELLKDKGLKDWETSFARLEMVQGRRKIFGAEVLAEGKRQDMVEMLRELIIGRQGKTPRVLVLGEPGSGKTTGMERLTLDLARAGSRRLGIGSKIPVLLRLENFQQETLLDFAAQKIEQATKRSSGEILSKGIKKLIKQGHVVLLCDALDEALGSRRDLVLAELKNFLEDQAYQNVHIVITSRTREDPGSGLKGLTTFEIQDLSDEAVNVFVRAYKQPEHSEAEITQRLQNHRLLEPGGLGRNPFWLRLIVKSGTFEGNKGQILNTAVDTLLTRELDKPEVKRSSWQRIPLKEEQREETKQALAWLGYRMSSGNVVTLEKDSALKDLVDWFSKRERVGVKGLRPQDVLGLGRDAQVLVYDPGPIRFRHRLVQEFMTAWMLKTSKKLFRKEIERRVQDLGWWETIFLLGGLLGAKNSSETFELLVMRLLGDGTDDQRLFAAVGLLLSVEKPPAELSNLIMTAFSKFVAISEGLTEDQFTAAQELGRILGDQAAEAFGVLFRSPNHFAKTQGAKLLCGIRGKRTNKILFTALGDEKESKVTIELLLSLGEEAIEVLISGLRDSDLGMRRIAAFTLGTIRNSRAVESLIAALHDVNSNMRNSAAEALGKIGDPRAVVPLITTLHDVDFDVCKNAIEALGKIRDRRAVTPLIALLRNSDSSLCGYAAGALGCIGDRRAVKPLIAVMSNSDQSVRPKAADALGKIGDPRAVEPLIATWREPRLFLFSFTHWTSRYSTGDAVDWFGECVAFALIRIGEIAIPSLITALSDLNTNVYLSAEYCLAKIGKAAIPSLMIGLCHQNSNVRACSAEVLGKMGDPNAFGGPLYWNIEVDLEISNNIAHAVGPLIAALLDEDSKVRSNAAHALIRIVDFRNIGQVLNLIRDSKPDISESVAKESEKIGYSYFVESLFVTLRDPDYHIRSAVSEIIGYIRDPRAVEPLISVLHDANTNVRSCAADALGKIGDSRAAEPLAMALLDPDENVRSRSRSSLEKINKLHNSRTVEEIFVLPIDHSLAQVARGVVEKIRKRTAENQRKAA